MVAEAAGDEERASGAAQKPIGHDAGGATMLSTTVGGDGAASD